MSKGRKLLILIAIAIFFGAILSAAGLGKSSPSDTTCVPTWNRSCPYGTDGPNLNYQQQQQTKQVCKELGAPGC